VWEQARVPDLQKYCDLVARAQAQLASSPEAAKDSAKLADKALPGRAAPAVILARAALALGSPQDAAKEFARARSVDPRSVEDPSTMHDLARALRKTGKRDEALAAYRALVPRIDLLGTPDRRVTVLLEAAHVSMAVAAAPLTASAAPRLAPLPPSAASGEAPPKGNEKAAADKGPAGRLDEAIAYLREARQRPPTQLLGDVVLSLVLVLDRSGDKAQADAALSGASETGAQARAVDYLAAEEDKIALDALALERSDPGGAASKWEQFLAGSGGKGPWAAAARARLDALRKGGAKTAKRPAAVAPPKPGATPAKPRPR
jgi:tetratricopeptide (TPR) repeat protein